MEEEDAIHQGAGLVEVDRDVHLLHNDRWMLVHELDGSADALDGTIVSEDGSRRAGKKQCEEEAQLHVVFPPSEPVYLDPVRRGKLRRDRRPM